MTTTAMKARQARDRLRSIPAVVVGKLSLGDHFLRDAAKISVGSAVAQGIALGVSPLLTRLYSPSDFGVLAVFCTVTAILSVLATARYEFAIVLPSSDREAGALAVLVLLITAVVSGATLMGSIWLAPSLCTLLRCPGLAPFARLVPVAVLVAGATQAFHYLATRRRQYTRLAISSVGQATGRSASSLSFGLGGFAAVGLILGSVIGKVTSLVVLASGVWAGKKRDEAGLADRKLLLDVARKYRDFPAFSLWHALLDTVLGQGSILLLSFYFGGAVLGLYALVLRVLKTPTELVGTAVSQILLERAARARNRGESIGRLVLSVFGLMTVLVLPPLLFVFCFGPGLFAFVFGESWRDAGVYARILCPWLLVACISSPLSQVPVVLRKQRQFLVFGVGYNLLMLVPILVLGHLGADARVVFVAISLLLTGWLVLALAWLLHISLRT